MRHRTDRLSGKRDRMQRLLRDEITVAEYVAEVRAEVHEYLRMERDKIGTETTEDWTFAWVLFALAVMFSMGFLFGAYVT